MGNYILDFLSMKSRELDTFVKVDREENIAEVVSPQRTFVARNTLWNDVKCALHDHKTKHISKNLGSDDEEESCDPSDSRKGPRINVKKSRW